MDIILLKQFVRANQQDLFSGYEQGVIKAGTALTFLSIVEKNPMFLRSLDLWEVGSYEYLIQSEQSLVSSRLF